MRCTGNLQHRRRTSYRQSSWRPSRINHRPNLIIRRHIIVSFFQLSSTIVLPNHYFSGRAYAITIYVRPQEFMPLRAQLLSKTFFFKRITEAKWFFQNQSVYNSDNTDPLIHHDCRKYAVYARVRSTEL